MSCLKKEKDELVAYNYIHTYVSRFKKHILSWFVAHLGHMFIKEDSVGILT